jgi:hypothetical protein
VRRKRRAGAKAREMKIIVTTTWSRELGLELPTPSIMHACLSVRREFRHLLTGLRIRNAGTREPGSQSPPVGEREARATPRARRSHTAARPGAHPAGRDRYRPRCARRGRHVTAAVHPSSSRPGPLIALNTGRLFTAYRHLRWQSPDLGRISVEQTTSLSYPTCRPLLIVEPSLCL